LDSVSLSAYRSCVCRYSAARTLVAPIIAAHLTRWNHTHLRGQKELKRFSSFNAPSLFARVSPSGVEFIQSRLNGNTSDRGLAIDSRCRNPTAAKARKSRIAASRSVLV
jgi:hypothetical protein